MRSALLQLVSVATVLASTSALAGPIIVHIQGPDGKPVAGASVAVPELMRKGTTGTDGSAALPDLPDRNVAVAVSAPGFKPALQSALVSGKARA